MAERLTLATDHNTSCAEKEQLVALQRSIAITPPCNPSRCVFINEFNELLSEIARKHGEEPQEPQAGNTRTTADPAQHPSQAP